MARHGMVFFFLALLLAMVVYEGWHLWKIVPGGWPVKLVFTGLFVCWFCVFVAGLAFTERFSVRTTVWLSEIGMPWMIVFVYLFLLFALADLALLCRLVPRAVLENNAVVCFSLVGFIAVLTWAGNLHYRHKSREKLTIQTDKVLERPLTIVFASDLHLGYQNRRPELARWIDLINAAHPDLVLLGGDVLDRSLRPVLEGNYAAEFRRLSAPAYAVFGNHEYYGDPEKARQFFADAGITLLQDEAVDVFSLRIIGREDRTNPARKPLSALLGEITEATSDLSAGMPPATPFTILLDHQPFHLEEAEAAGIDFQFSGHTHRGQIWPANWVTDAMYEKSWGSHTRGHTRYYISSGLGIWGPKVRLGSRSEYLVLHLTHTGQN